jgi:hypothetical protein
VGGRRPGSFRHLRGRSRASRNALNNLNQTILRGAAADVIVGAAVGLLAASSPAGATIALGWAISGSVKDTYEDTQHRLENGEDLPSALGKAMVKVAARNAVGSIAGQMTAAAVPKLIADSGIRSSPEQRVILAKAASGAVSEVIG